MSEEQNAASPVPFRDWRVGLGITCGVLAFAMGVILWSLVDPQPSRDANAQSAWNLVMVVTVAVIGGGALVEKWRRWWPGIASPRRTCWRRGARSRTRGCRRA